MIVLRGSLVADAAPCTFHLTTHASSRTVVGLNASLVTIFHMSPVGLLVARSTHCVHHFIRLLLGTTATVQWHTKEPRRNV